MGFKVRTWLAPLGTAAILTAGASCTSSGKQAATPTGKAVAEALTTGANFPDGLIKKGAIPAADADKVSLAQNDPPIKLKPGDSVIMSLDADNPDEDSDPVDATLIQFEDSDSHIEVPRASGDGGSGDAGPSDTDAGSQTGVARLKTRLDLDGSTCDNLCNQEFTIRMFQAVLLKSGKVSKKLNRDFTLDCTEHGDSSKCEKSSSKSDAGTSTKTDSGSSNGKGGSSGGGDASVNSYGGLLSGAYTAFDLAACGCGSAADMAGGAYCANAPFSSSTVTCIKDGINAANASDVSTAASCQTQAINQAAATCMSGCGACTAADLMSAVADCGTLPEVDSCLGAADAGSGAGGGGA